MPTEIDCENANNSLMPGMYAEASIAMNQKNDALTVPIQAVNRNGQNSTVLVLDRDNAIQERQVTLGVEGNNRVEVVSGLSENQRVVIGNRSQFRPGQKVQPQPFHDNKEAKSAEGHS
jgi:multidrug efflux pump subunit AcrA (membrane-fusion protein)